MRDRRLRRRRRRPISGTAPVAAARCALAGVLLLTSTGCGSEAGPAVSRRAPAVPLASAGDTVPHPPIARGEGPLEAPSAATEPLPHRFGFGRAADSAEILRLEIDVLPDGTGLPPGRGTVARGARVYRGSCATCHGATGREGPFDPLVSPPGEREFPTSLHRTGTLTVGNYWPHATSLFEYVARAMPMHAPGTLEADDVYAVVAWILHRNGLIEEDDVMDRETLPRVSMPGRGRFVVDDRSGGATIR